MRTIIKYVGDVSIPLEDLGTVNSNLEKLAGSDPTDEVRKTIK